jgi:uncharacterized protein
MRIICLAVAVAVLAWSGCGGDASSSRPQAASTATRSGPVFEQATAVIETNEGAVRLDVEVAKTDEQRHFGLMFRAALPAESGMVFLYDWDQTGDFWMKNTLIPLSIAFYDARGRILRMLDMEPCSADPCPLYDAGVAYRGALEVNQGAFRRWGVEEGDRVVLKVSVA